MDNTPFVSVIIPVRNEENYISKCLNSIVSQDYTKGKLEILVIDGISEDGTVQKIKDFLKQAVVSSQWSENNNQKTEKKEEDNTLNVRVLDNPKKIVPCGLNTGIKETKGDYIIRMDAHTEYAIDYVTKCVEWLVKTGVENVGGPMQAKGKGNVGKSIEFAHHCRFGLGGGKFHDRNYSGYADTVYLGAWPKRVFKEVGLFDERLVRNQDIELNARIRKAGSKIYITPEIKSYYYCRDTLKGLWEQNFENGKWVIYTKKIAPYCLSWRHFVPFLFVGSLILSGILSLLFSQFDLDKLFALCSLLFAAIILIYVSANLYFTAQLSFKNGFRYFFILPVVFATLHFSYGIGSILGLISLRK